MSILNCAIIIFIITIFGDLVSSEKLNERRILLPYNSGIPTNFTLEALSTESCYKWSSSRPDIASVRHLDDPSCSKKAVVTVVSRIARRQSSVITAHDLKSNVQMRCDVEVDVLNRIEITTTTREIVYGELPEMIKAVAFDSKNDIFSSIGGIQFDWIITPQDVIRYRTWASSSYAAPDFVEYWESRGAKSSYVLVEGVRTGLAKIKVRITDSAYQEVVEPAEITVHVVANLLLTPSNDVFLVRGAKVGFRAEISKQGPRIALNLPSPQYYIEVIDSNVAQFDEQTNQLEALEEGHTSLVLRDRNVDLGDEGQVGLSQTSTDIHVMRPSYITIEISPGEKFALRSDTLYVIRFTLHDDWHHRLYPSDNLILNGTFPTKYFSVLESTQNGTYHVVRTLHTGSCKIKAQFIGAGSFPLLEGPLEQIQDVTIYPPITLTPTSIFLPWIPATQPIYTVNVEASGATGEYNWETENDSLATVKYSPTRSSHAVVYTKGDGQVEISCNDVHNSLIFNSQMTINVRPIEAIEILPSIVETNIGGNVVLPVAVLGFLNGKDGQKVYFDDCGYVEFDVEVVEKHRIRYQKDNILPGFGARSCRSLSFECLANGNSRIWISYGQSKQISTSVIVGCYSPLKLVHPPEYAVLSLGSIIDIAFEGGPRPWSMYPEGHYTNATLSNSSVLQIKEIKDRYRYNKDLHVFRARCSSYGETIIDLTVGNSISPTLSNPASTSSTVKIICAKPETLIIRPKMKSTCPQQDLVFQLEKGKEIELEVQVLDGKGHSFYNFSTLYFDWSKDGNGVFEEDHGIKEEVNGVRGYFSLTRSFQKLKGLTTARSKARGRITGYHGSYFGDTFDVRREIELVMTDRLTTADDNVSILKHSSYKKLITIEKGSGYFSIDWTGKDTIQIEFPNTANQKLFNIIPKQIGNGQITITDQCLDYQPLTVAYSVVEALDIKVQIIDKIQLGSSVEGTFYVLDNRGNKLDSSLHSMFDFAILSSNSFLSISDVKPLDQWSSCFQIKADRLGLSKISIQSQSDQVRSIQSQPAEIQIFSPLKIVPSNITLIVGNYFQVNFVGGPQTQRNVEFSLLEDSSIASVSSSGLIQAMKVGKTKLTGRVMNVNNFEYSRADIELHVVPLRKIKIWTPVNQLLTGSNVPLYLIGQSEQFETPFMFGNADPALKVTWSLSNEKIGTIEATFEEFGITDSSSDQICANFVARAIGTVTVKVRVEIISKALDSSEEQILANRILTDSVQFNVYSDFAISFQQSNQEFVKLSTQALLLSPNAEFVLHFNHLDRITYKMVNNTQVRIVNNTELILQAGDQLEFASLFINRDVHKSGLLQHFTYPIQVEKVRYLSLRLLDQPSGVDTKVHFHSSKIDVFPIGSEISVSVQYYDSLGRQFAAVKSNLKWTLSRNDIVTIIGGPLDGLLKIRSLKEGSVVIHLYDQVNQIGSYFKINVGTIIEPRFSDPITVSVSDILCLRTKMSSSSVLGADAGDSAEVVSSNGIWSVEDGKIGFIGPTSGTFVALNVGKSTIVFNSTVSGSGGIGGHGTTGGSGTVVARSPTGLSTYSNIVVRPLDRLYLEAEHLSGVSTTSSLLIPIVTTSDKLPDHQHRESFTKLCSSNDIKTVVHSLKSNRQLPFTCDVSFHNSPLNSIWDSELQFNTQTGRWNCMLIPKSDLDLISLSLYNLNVTVSVFGNLAIGGSGQDLAQLTDPFSNFHQISLPFLPAFQPSIKQIILTSDSKEIRFTINSVPTVLEELTIKSSNDDILEVKKMSIGENSLKVAVILRNADIFSNDVSNLHLFLVSTLTNQTERISVQIKLYGTLQQLPSQIFSINFYYSVSLILGTIMLATLIYFALRRLSESLRSKDYYYPPDPNNGSIGSSGASRGYFDLTKSFTTPKRLYSSFASSNSPRRVIDYNNSPQSPSTGATTTGTLNNHPLSSSSPSSSSFLGSPAPGGVSTTASPHGSPKVGRPLFSTRQYLLQ